MPARRRPALRRVLAAVAVLAGTLTVATAASALPERCHDTSVPALDAAVREMLGWLTRNQRADGTWRYEYDPRTGRDLGGYNWVRHAGLLEALEQAAADGFAEARPVADRGWLGVEGNVRRFGDRAALVDPPDGLVTGGTALLAVALADRRDSTGDRSRDTDLLALGRYLARAVRPDGAVDEDGDPTTGALRPGTPSTFTTGEAMYGLARLELAFPGNGFADAARRIGTYLVERRAVAEGYVPDISEHWGAYGFDLLTQAPAPAPNVLSDRDVAWIRRQMGLGSIQVRYDSQRTDEGAFLLLRGHRAPAAGMGTVAEALGGWYRTAVREPRLAAYAARVRDRLACDGGVLADRTVTAAEAARYPDPVMVEGAVITSGVGRMDDQQHALSGVLAARDALARPPARPLPRRHPAPESWLLVVAVALAAWNPVRAGRATAAVARRWVVLGAAGVAVLVAVVTALGGPVLDALSVSDGSALIAAGVATVLSALVALGPWALRPEPAGGSWHDALVPVAVPVLVRADLVALAIACGAGGRGWPYVGGLVLAAALTALASRWRPAPGGTGDRVQRWAARGVAIAAVALGIGVIVEGAFTI